MGSPQILICGESGGNGRTYDLAERYRPLRSICRTRSLVIPYILFIHSLFINLTKCLSNPYRHLSMKVHGKYTESTG